MALMIWLLGLADVWLTNYGLQLGVINEGNPVMAYFFQLNPTWAIVFSLSISAVLLYFLQRLCLHTMLAKKALRGLLLVRIFVIVLHLNWLYQHYYL
ncbi:MAG TPA: hypothetical protein DCE00_02535 [Firmicutes bacterium]|jgi:hypothetical protein|nr:hypothetical protein [Bacillota bacterium]HAA37731.1 hypothetical protein [Bacillota bacterium]